MPAASRYDGVMPRGPHRFPWRADALALGTLVATAVAVAWPLLHGGVSTYVDNPMHLAEIHSLAFDAGRGWSGIAYCGVPLGHLHSPLWYGMLGALVRAGAPAEPSYALALLIGFMAPALALYAVGRRQLPAAAAALLAYLLLVQRTSVVGLGAALGGMWTFYLGCGFWILLVDRVTQPIRTTRHLLAVSALVGLVTLTHLFLVVPTALLGLLHAVRLLRRPRHNARALMLQAAAGVLGVLAAAVYWGPLLYTRDALTIGGHTLSVPMIFARLLVPTRIVDLLVGRFSMAPPRLLAEAAPMILLVGAGVVGAFLNRGRVSRLALYGSIVAALLFALLTAGRSAFAFVTGPLSWRLLTVVRVALALSAIPLLAVMSRRMTMTRATPLRHAATSVLIVVALAASVVWNQSLRPFVPTSRTAGMRDVSAVWDWLREHATPQWGRVYVQDTLYAESVPGPLRYSHVMARTAAEASVHQLGAAYSAVPFPTARWTAGEFGRVFGSRLRTARDLQRLREAAWRSNTTHFVLCDPGMAARLAGSGSYEPVYRSGIFTVLRDVDARSSWADLATGSTRGIGNHEPQERGHGVHVERYDTGRIALRVESGGTGATVLVKEAHHPFWRLTSGDGPLPVSVALERDDWGLMRIAGLTAGRHDIVLEYAPPRWPLLLTLACAVLGGSLAVRTRAIPGGA
jgi:hypothetical protein